jgi:hypothetical protein
MLCNCCCCCCSVLSLSLSLRSFGCSFFPMQTRNAFLAVTAPARLLLRPHRSAHIYEPTLAHMKRRSLCSFSLLLLPCTDVVPRCDLRANAPGAERYGSHQGSCRLPLPHARQIRWRRGYGVRCALHVAPRCSSRSNRNSRSVVSLIRSF